MEKDIKKDKKNKTALSDAWRDLSKKSFRKRKLIKFILTEAVTDITVE